VELATYLWNERFIFPKEVFSMEAALLIGVVAVLGITCVYFWVVRRSAQEKAPAANAGPEQK
jgi:hypothetical protein